MFYLILLTIVTVTFLIFLSIVFVNHNGRMMEKDRQEFFKDLIEANRETYSHIEVNTYSLNMNK